MPVSAQSQLQLVRKCELLVCMFKEMERIRCKTQNKPVKYSDLTFTLLSGTFLQDDLIGDSGLGKQ